MKTYIVAARYAWNRRLFQEKICRYAGRWFFVDAPEALQLQWVKTVDPRYIFFVQWSWRVPSELVHAYECVCFHMTDVPYGRGGSPLQNLIVRGQRETTLTALRMVEEFDAGPVYLKEPLSLEGLAEEIYIRVSRRATEMILKIIQEEIAPVPQTGMVEVFRRRPPSESEIPQCEDLLVLFDFMRMLDAEGFPRAFLMHKGFRYEFSRPALYDGRIVADVRVTAARQDEPQ